MSTNNTVETLKVRFPTISESRIALLARAVELGADDELVAKLGFAARVYVPGEQVKLPAGRYAHLSRAKGWARLGRDTAVRGEKVSGGYSVSECGTWLVYSSDGFKREERVSWVVSTVAVGSETWHIVVSA